jgi:hypothetical protein
MPVSVSTTPMTTVADPKTRASSWRQPAPLAETQTGVLDVWLLATTEPTATKPPLQRSTDLTCASGSAGASFRQLMPVQGVPAAGGTGVVKADGPTGDGSAEGTGSDGCVETPGEAAGGDASAIGDPAVLVDAFGAGAQPASSKERTTSTGAVRTSRLRCGPGAAGYPSLISDPPETMRTASIDARTTPSPVALAAAVRSDCGVIPSG